MLMPVQHDSLPDDVEYNVRVLFSVNLFNTRKLTLFLMLNLQSIIIVQSFKWYDIIIVIRKLMA